jgi:hypothetical protein
VCVSVKGGGSIAYDSRHADVETQALTFTGRVQRAEQATIKRFIKLRARRTSWNGGWQKGVSESRLENEQTQMGKLLKVHATQALPKVSNTRKDISETTRHTSLFGKKKARKSKIDR